MHFNVINLVQKVYRATNNYLSKDSPMYSLCRLAEENKIALHQEIYNSKLELLKLNQNLNDCKHLTFDVDFTLKIKSSIDTINRVEELIFVHLKQILSPHWKHYWSEGCTDLSIINHWIDRAEKDNFQKLNKDSNVIHLNDERFLD
jgi:hypothetical protein